MALVFCPDCGKQVSEFAEACPNCGYPVKSMISSLSKETTSSVNNDGKLNDTLRETNHNDSVGNTVSQDYKIMHKSTSLAPIDIDI